MLNFLSKRCGRIYTIVHALESVQRVSMSCKRNMSSELGVTHWLSRVNNQVNYERKFYGSEKVVVTIPTFHFEAFDMYLSRTQIKPWELLDLLASARFFSHYPVQHTENPRDSIADIHMLMEGNISFVAALKIDINELFHTPESPKFPLTVTVEITHVGRSSLRQSFDVKHPGTSTPYFTCECDEVLISKINRRPAAFPDWWVDKYSKLIKPKEKLIKPPIAPGAVMKTYDMAVEFEHLDLNSHTGTSAYLKLSINAAFKSIRHERIGCISLEHVRAGLKSIQMFFHGESSFGDILNITTYDNSSRGNEMLVEISKRSSDKEGSDEMCCTVVFEFYEPKSP